MSYLQDDCTAFIPAMGDICAMRGADRRWVHDNNDHSQCEPEGCYGHKYQPPTEVEAEVITIDLTPTWAGIILPLAEAYAVGGSTEARDELLRLARHVDGRRS